MADVQPDRYTKWSNDYSDALIRYRLPGEQMQVLQYVIRKTWGYRKKKDRIALSQFVNATGLKKSSVSRAIKGLEEKNMIIINKSVNDTGHEYSIQKDFDAWKPFTKKKIINKNVNKLLLKCKKSFTKKSTTKDSIKDNITKDSVSDLKKSESYKTDYKKEIESLKERYINKGLINQLIDAFASTRQLYKIADSIVYNQFKRWLKYPVIEIEESAIIYITGGHPSQGKGEDYFMGIVRNFKDSKNQKIKAKVISQGPTLKQPKLEEIPKDERVSKDRMEEIKKKAGGFVSGK